MNIDYENLVKVLIEKAYINDNQVCNELDLVKAVIYASGLLDEVERLHNRVRELECPGVGTSDWLVPIERQRDSLQIENLRLRAAVNRVGDVISLMREQDGDNAKINGYREYLTAALKDPQ